MPDAAIAMQVSNAVVAASAVAPGNTPRNGAPGPRKPAPQISGVCNSYLPSSSVVERLLYVVNYFTQNGFYVILDNQLNIDSTAVTDINKWVNRVGQSCHLDQCIKWMSPCIVRSITCSC